jgi:uncharacterized protein (UPF0305 family)
MSHCLVPVSLGELFDKYSILEIKSERINDQDKLLNIKKEIQYLKPHIEKYSLDKNTFHLIKNVNEELWEIEDKIRDKERSNEFDDEFIMLARSVYRKNDERSRVKNVINKLLNSDIIDIKSYSKY